MPFSACINRTQTEIFPLLTCDQMEPTVAWASRLENDSSGETEHIKWSQLPLKKWVQFQDGAGGFSSGSLMGEVGSARGTTRPAVQSLYRLTQLCERGWPSWLGCGYFRTHAQDWGTAVG